MFRYRQSSSITSDAVSMPLGVCGHAGPNLVAFRTPVHESGLAGGCNGGGWRRTNRRKKKKKHQQWLIMIRTVGPRSHFNLLGRIKEVKKGSF